MSTIKKSLANHLRASVGQSVAAVLCLGLFAATCSPVVAHGDETSSEWPSFRGNNAGLTSAKTPRAASEAKLLWQKSFTSKDGSHIGSPILLDDSLYIAAGNKLYKLNKSGAVLLSAALESEISNFSMITAGDGKIFVPQEGGAIQAFSADTLTPLWISHYQDASGSAAGYHAESSILYHDGYIYTGVYKYVNYYKTEGTFFVIEVKDDNPSLTNEEKPYAWKLPEPASERKGYYWSGSVLSASGEQVIFAGDEGVIYSVAAKPTATTTVIDSVSVRSASDANDESFVRAGLLSAGGRVYATTKSGYLWSVSLNADGTFNKGELRSQKLSGVAGAATPVLANGRLYVLSGYLNNGGRLDVLDAITLSKISSLNFGGYSQSSPLLSTAYSAANNGNAVYLYVTLNEAKSDDVIVIKDSATAPNPEAAVLYAPKGSFSFNSLIADNNGTLYFIDGGGRLSALGYQDQPDTPAPPPTNSPDGNPDPKETTGEFKDDSGELVTVTLKAVKDQVWTGKAIRPSVKVNAKGISLKAGKDYVVSYSDNKKIGSAKLTVKAKGKYLGTLKAVFRIIPKATKVSKIKAGSKQAKVVWKKVSAKQKVTKYQLRYRVKGKSTWKVKSVSAKKNSLLVTKLTKAKKYQIQVRSYKKVAKVNYYSTWSKTKTSDKVK